MLTIAGLVVLASASLATPFMTFQAPPAAPTQDAGSGAAPAAPQTAVVPSEWPQVATTDGVTFTINEPSYTAIAGNTVTLRAVVQVKRATGSPTAGTLDMTAVGQDLAGDLPLQTLERAGEIDRAEARDGGMDEAGGRLEPRQAVGSILGMAREMPRLARHRCQPALGQGAARALDHEAPGLERDGDAAADDFRRPGAWMPALLLQPVMDQPPRLATRLRRADRSEVGEPAESVERGEGDRIE